jgi:hypothetical protein
MNWSWNWPDAMREVSIENTDDGSKAVRVNSKMPGSWSFRGSCMIQVTTYTYCDYCRKAGPDI